MRLPVVYTFAGNMFSSTQFSMTSTVSLALDVKLKVSTKTFVGKHLLKILEKFQHVECFSLPLGGAKDTGRHSLYSGLSSAPCGLSVMWIS